MGCASELDFDTTGSSTSSGSRPRARLTRSRTSAAAASRSDPSSNSTRTVLRPSRLTEVSVRTPEMAFTDSSMGSVTWFSMTSALAPRSVVETEMMGVSVIGYSRTPRLKNAMSPPITMASESTVARTGRRTDRS